METRVQALLAALVVFRLLPRGFSNRDLRQHLAPLLGLDSSLMTQGRMTYDLRWLHIHAMIQRIPGSHRYLVTDFALRSALFLTRAYSRVVRPGLAAVIPPAAQESNILRSRFLKLEQAMDDWVTDAQLAA